MTISHFCFVVAASAALVGMSLGIHMGMTQDFTLAPVHAHLNLLGWVTMLLYGLYYRREGLRPGRLAWLQVLAAVAGFPAMAGGLAVLLTSPEAGAGEPVIVAGSLLTIGSMALFMAVVLRDIARPRATGSRLAGLQEADLPEYDPSSG